MGTFDGQKVEERLAKRARAQMTEFLKMFDKSVAAKSFSSTESARVRQVDSGAVNLQISTSAQHLDRSGSGRNEMTLA
jgi:hypothetical protein